MGSAEEMGSKRSFAQAQATPSGIMLAVRNSASAVDCDSRYVVAVVVVVGKPFCPEHDAPRHGSGVGTFGHWPQGSARSKATVCAAARRGVLELTSCVKTVKEKKV